MKMCPRPPDPGLHDRGQDLCHNSRGREPVRLAASSFFPPETTMRFAPLLLALALAFPVAAVHGETRIPDAALAKAEQLREQALASDLGWKITESLTTEVGPRLPGTEADARAVAWAKAKFEELGYDQVWTEPVTFPTWERRGERAGGPATPAQPLGTTPRGGQPADP